MAQELYGVWHSCAKAPLSAFWDGFIVEIINQRIRKSDLEST